MDLNLEEDQSKIKDSNQSQTKEAVENRGSFIDLTKKFLALQMFQTEMKRLNHLYDNEEPVFVSKVYRPLMPNGINQVAKIQKPNPSSPSKCIKIMVDLKDPIHLLPVKTRMESRALVKYKPPFGLYSPATELSLKFPAAAYLGLPKLIHSTQ